MNLAIWGCGLQGKKMLDIIKAEDKDIVKFFFENNFEKVGDIVEGIEVVSKYRIKELMDSEIDMILIPEYLSARLLCNQILEAGVAWNQICMMDIESFSSIYKTEGSMSNLIKREKMLYMMSIDYEVVEHCNLNCTGCNHFANISPKRWKSVDEFSKDLTRLSELVDSIGFIKLLGGEPLLHENLQEFIIEAHRIYPNAKIAVITNGILLHNMSEELIKAIRDNNAYIELTVYPINKMYLDELIKFLKRHDIKYKIFHVADEFSGQFNLNGDSEPVKAEKNCYARFCYLFGDGHISKCMFGFKINVFNDKFATSLPESKINIHDKNLTGKKLERYLHNPITLCSYCGKPNVYEWNSRHIDKNSIEQYLGVGAW